MIAESTTDQERFGKNIQALFRSQASDSLQKLKNKSFDHFLELGLPTKRTEVFQYVKLRQLFAKELTYSEPFLLNQQEVSPHILPECEDSYLTFVNGTFRAELSSIKSQPSKVVVIPLSEAMRTFNSLLSNSAAKQLQIETDPFVALNGALAKEASFVYIPKGTVLEKPLQILHFLDSSKTSLISPRVEFFMGVQAEAKIVSKVIPLSGEDYFVNSTLNFSLEEGAKVNLTHAVVGLPSKSWYFEAVRVLQKRDSSFESVNVTDGAQGVRFDYHAILEGENAECYLNGLWLLSGNREAHNHVRMEHLAPNCRSMQFFKGALKDFSHSSFEGKIYVHREAQKTQAFQLNNNLLLSERAQADCKPNLEIFADDVKATHGATVGQIDESELFYLMTRGISKEVAKNLLIAGFLEEIIQKISVPSLRLQVEKTFLRSL